MDKLPDDMLREIFFLAVLQSSWLSPAELGSTRISIITPLRVSHVCQHWHSLALTDGRLWSYLYIEPYSFRAGKALGMESIFDTWMARSGKAPLNFGVFFDFKREIPDEDEVKLAVHIVTTLIENQHRWGDVDFIWAWDYGEWPSDVQGFDMTSMPMLTSLRLLFKRQGHVTINFGRSSQLRKVNIYGDFSISASEESLRHLKEPSRLVFRDGYKSEDAIRSCQNFLSTAPLLEEINLEFENGLSLPTSPLNEDRPIHHGLRRLNLSYYWGSDVFIDNVTLPSLHILTYRCESPNGGEKLLHFFERSLPPLTHLEVDGLKTFEDTFILCLRLLPSLQKLKVGDVTVSTRFFRELSIPDNGSGDVVCPALEALFFYKLECSDDEVACVEAVISMLESRAKIMMTFRNVWFPGLQVRDSTIEPSKIREYAQEERFFNRMTVGKMEVPFNPF